jgi:hypothetical protein
VALELDDDEEVASVGLSPPQAVVRPAPASAAPPERRIRKSRLSVSFAWSSRVRSSDNIPPQSRGVEGF